MHSDALGEVARGLEIVDLACGITTQLKGELSTQVSTGVDVAAIRQPLGVVAGITPFNFPPWCRCGCSAGHRLRQHLRAEAQREGPVGLRAAGRAADGGRAPGRRLQRRPRRQARRGPAAGAPRRGGGVLRGLDAHRPVRARHGHRERQAGAGLWAAPRTTCWCCPTPTSTRRPTPRSPLRTARRASAAWRSRRSSRSARPATRSWRRSASGPRRSRSGPARTRTRRWDRSSPASTATRSPPT